MYICPLFYSTVEFTVIFFNELLQKKKKLNFVVEQIKNISNEFS